MARSEASVTSLVRDRDSVLECRERNPAARRYRLALNPRLARDLIFVHHLQLRRSRPAGTFERGHRDRQTSVVFNLHGPAQPSRRSENLVSWSATPSLWTPASVQVTPD